jgi:hypothetical protein
MSANLSSTNPLLTPKDDNPLTKYGLGEISNVKVQNALAAHVNKQFEWNKQHKRNIGITERLIRNLRAKRCEYQPDEKLLLGEFNNIYVAICALKARAAESWLIDIIVNNIDKPWTLNPSVEPDLPDRLKEQVIDALLLELPEFKTFDALKDRAQQLKSAVQSIAVQQATATVQRMETHIQGQLQEGGWVDTFSAFIADLVVFPAAMIRGPISVGRPTPEWDGDNFTIKNESVLTTRTISPFNAYPAPNSSTCQDGNNFIEAIEYTHSDIHDLISVPSFLESNIRQVLDKYALGYTPTRIEDSTKKALEGKEQPLTSHSTGLEVRIYNGKIIGKMLAENGVLISDPQKFYECEVWVIGEYVIRAVLNPNPLGKRPIYGTSYVKVNGSFWGQSVIDTVYDVMRVCNAACRSIVRNMGYASGPVGEVDAGRLAPGEDGTEIEPYKIFQVGPDLTGTGGAAFKFHNVSMIAGELKEVFEYYMKLADDLSGVPAYVLGNPQVAGAGRTLGGLSMLMGNAAKGIKNVQLNIDRDVITGVVDAYYYYNMVVSTDNGIKADAKVVARGATGLLQRELAQTRTVEILQLLTPYAQQGLVSPQGIEYLLREVLKPTGMDIDKIIPDPDKASSENEIGTLLGGQGQSPSPPPPALPQQGGPQTPVLNTGTNTPPRLPAQSQPPLPTPNMQPFPKPVNLPQGA